MKKDKDKGKDLVVQKLLEAIKKAVDHISQSDPDLVFFLNKEALEAKKIWQESSI